MVALRTRPASQCCRSKRRQGLYSDQEARFQPNESPALDSYAYQDCQCNNPDTRVFPHVQSSSFAYLYLEAFTLNFDESIDGCIVRRASVADVRTISVLDRDVLGAYARPAMAFRQSLDSDPSSLFVAEMKGIVVGYCLVGRSASSNAAWVFSVGVDVEQRRRGLGRVLVRSALDYLVVNDAFVTLASVDRDNAGALALLESLGFERVSIEQDYFSDGVARWRMSKKS